MTELEQFRAMVSRFEMTPDNEMAQEIIETTRGDKIVVTVPNTHTHGSRGYMCFYSDWTFDKTTGQLLSVEHWE